MILILIKPYLFIESYINSKKYYPTSCVLNLLTENVQLFFYLLDVKLKNYARIDYS